MSAKKLLTTYSLGNSVLSNRIVMAPMTRSRAINNLPNDLHVQYYRQRASAGLIITEGVSPSPNGLGYSRIPGLFSQAQVEAWKPVTAAVHQAGGRIFVQLMHTGRIGHSLNLPAGARVLAPSAVQAPGQMWTDQSGMLDHPVPQPLTAQEILEAKAEYVAAARNAVAAGFDGVELHAANGYLLEQFISPHTNRRTDTYGGSIENRARFVLEVAQEVSLAIGKEKTGIRLSPYGVFNDMPHYPEIDQTYVYLAGQLNKIGVMYIHLLDHSRDGAPEVPLRIKQLIRSSFKQTLIFCGGYDAARAEAELAGGTADLIAFGKPFINNPDLPVRLQKEVPLHTNIDFTTLYTPGEKGYTDYPAYAESSVTA